MMKLAVFMIAVAVAATAILFAFPTSPERPMRTPVVKKVSDTPPASSKGAKIKIETLARHPRKRLPTARAKCH